MLTLLILRHAKAGSDKPGLRDIDRPLAPRGQSAAPAMGRFIAGAGLSPDLILCSPARRTRETLDLVQPELKGSPEVRVVETLYLAEAEQILDAVKTLAGDHKRVMVIGHNPGLQELVMALSGHGAWADLAALRAKFPTAGLAVITFDAESWSQVLPGTGTLAQLQSPRRTP